MFWTVKQTALFLNLKHHQVYYLLTMGYIEAVQVGNVWRIIPDSARAYSAEKRAA